MKKIYLIGVISLLAITTVTGFLYWQWISSPQYSLWQAKKAVDKHDFATFEKYVDVEGLAEEVIEQMIELKVSQQEESADYWEKVGQKFAQQMILMVKPQLVKLVKQEVVTYIEKGDFDSQVKDKSNDSFSLGDWSKKNFNAKSKLEGIEYVKKEGNIALIGLKITLEQSAQPVILELKMQDQGGYWRIIGLNNLAEFLQKIDKVK